MITITEYFGVKPHSKEQESIAADLIERRNRLREEWARATGKECPIDPDTGTEISGSRDGAGDGGFRLETATTGRPGSPHKQACGIDDYDPGNELDDWLDLFEGENGANPKLEEHGLYRERPGETPGWCHLQTRRPPSGRRTFIP